MHSLEQGEQTKAPESKYPLLQLQKLLLKVLKVAGAHEVQFVLEFEQDKHV